MIRVNPVQFNTNSRKYISFGEGNMNNITPSVAILALKELTESTDNKERYNMLRKLGADEKMINKSLFRQIAIFFMFPLLIAIIHSIFGITFCSYIIETFGNEQLLPSIIMTAIFIVVFYGGYFLITYLSSKNIIKENRNAREY